MADAVSVHPLAVVEPGAELGAGVSVGPFCTVSAGARLGPGTRLVSHVAILGDTTLGSRCTVYPTAVLGAPPQNFKHEGGRSALVIGDDCTIREGVTVHAGTDTSRALTSIGDRCFLMANSHVAHDCALGNDVTMANYAGLGGHVEIGDHVIVSGYAAVHQFVRIGHHAFLAGLAMVVGDVIPYGMAAGDRAVLRGFNLVGLKRSGMTRSELTRMRQAYRALFARDRPLAEAIAAVRAEHGDFAPVRDMLDFIGDRQRRYLTVPAAAGAAADDDAA
ncbi:acyl-ACP--UDP-N-acetylglucosamine O-acyltransferase [Aquibium sp. A9E412]|uniref:acyl-ACP--UDP-N-acetylglucosamine O-acyltransferase n=1 Tax=Aquibium sp. A9E412 TaxID=2976767 RepID=UPI0025B21AF6|nr:acyl-ACP--UDP-N-acetylglucosamine O-acyltransferase [Aquibium sp. A9E412]MDN2564701.1 acyl-ACP--UDP-N-acetylglucosamine O-acyltransferase [Aquibium sp. A9E412]